MYKTITTFLDLLINPFFKKYFYVIFFTYIKMFENSSAKYCQHNQDKLQKQLVKDIKVFLKKKKKKSDNMVVKDTKFLRR